MKRYPVILCVDDEHTVLTSVVGQLRQAFHDQYLYETAQSTEEAWEILDEMMQAPYEVKLIISDWLMPIEKGDTFLMKVAQKYPSIHLVMLSGHADEESIERAKRYANLRAFIRKPWDKETFIHTIQTILSSETNG
jgi:CheY-like chemotaxis protein